MSDRELSFEVFVLGMRGSGKTVFLSALHNQLSVLDVQGDNFYVELGSAQQALQLKKIYKQLANPGDDWPAGTVGKSEYAFHCFYTAGSDPVPLFRFLYRDYPGGFIDDEADGSTTFIREATRTAHAILVLIDGQKVLQTLEGQEQELQGHSLHDDLNALIPLLQRGADRPVQFLTTKWDILHPQHTLQEVRDLLLENHNFKKFVEQRAKWKLPVHLIPVSAVGMNFARFDRRDMRMKKVRNGACKPFNVELAIGMTITDQIQLSSIHPKRNLGALLLWITRILRGSTDVLEKSLEISQFVIGFPRFIPIDGIRRLLRDATENIQVSEDWLRSKIEEEATKIRDQKSAVESVMKIQAWRRKMFERNFPESQLVALGDA